MLGVCRSEPKSLAVFTNSNARRYSVRTEMPGGDFQFDREALFGQNRNSWRYFPVWVRGVFRPEEKFLAVLTSFNARRFRSEFKFLAKFGCEAFLQSEPKLLAVFSKLDAMRFSARPEIPD